MVEKIKFIELEAGFVKDLDEFLLRIGKKLPLQDVFQIAMFRTIIGEKLKEIGEL